MKLNFPALVGGLLLCVSIGLGGCDHADGPSIAGDWEVQKPGSAATLHAHPDHSFTLDAVTGQSVTGRWEVDGMVVKLYRDIRNGGDSNFGDGADDASTYHLSKDLQSMTAGSGTSIATLKKVK